VDLLIDLVRKMQEKALKLYEQFYSYDTVTHAKILGNIGLLYADMEDPSQATHYLNLAKIFFSRELRSNHPHIDMINDKLEGIKNATKTNKSLGFSANLLSGFQL